MRLACSLTLLLTLTVAPAPASASEIPPPLTAREEVDLPLVASFGALWLVTELGLKDQFAAPDFDPLTYQEIGEGDRSAIGLWDPDLSTASDVLLYSSFAIPFAIQGIDDLVWGAQRQDAPRWFWTDTVILLEAVFFAGALTNMAKWAFNRYRPYMYVPTASPEEYAGILQGEDDSRAEFEDAFEDRDAALSFWSGHSALVFSAMTTSATLMTYKHLGDHPAPLIAMWAGTIAYGLTVAVLRVRSGKHFPSDVIVGGLVGATCGLVIPALHRNRAVLPVAVAPIADREGGGVAISAIW